MTTTMQLAAVKETGGAISQMADQKIDMFSLRGFELAQRIANGSQAKPGEVFHHPPRQAQRCAKRQRRHGFFF